MKLFVPKIDFLTIKRFGTVDGWFGTVDDLDGWTPASFWDVYIYTDHINDGINNLQHQPFWKPPICRGHQMSEGTMEVQLLLASQNPQRWIFHAAGIWEVNLSYGCILCQSNDPPGLPCSGRTPRPFDSQNQEYFLHQSKLRKTSESPTAKNITGITGRRTHGK